MSPKRSKWLIFCEWNRGMREREKERERERQSPVIHHDNEIFFCTVMKP